MNKKKTAQQCVLLVIAAACIAYGAFRGEAQTVLNKAINICFECIGLG